MGKYLTTIPGNKFDHGALSIINKIKQGDFVHLAEATLVLRYRTCDFYDL